MNDIAVLQRERLDGFGVRRAVPTCPERADSKLAVRMVHAERSGDAEHAAADRRFEQADDAELIRATARQDRRAFEALYRRYSPRIGGYLYKMLRSPELVEEAFNDVMTVVWRNAARYDGRGKASTWLFGIAHNKALKTLERARRHRIVDSLEDEGTPDLDQIASADQTTDPEHEASLADRTAMLGQALETLSADQRSVVELTFKQGFSYPEIAQIAGIPVNTVKTRMFHARKRLVAAVAALERPPGAPAGGALP